MHIDLNSCFATVEQQANPLLRGKPIVVAAYVTDRGCILAASVEAKRLGIKTGMHVYEGKTLYPKLIVLPSDPPKYRFINRKLLALLSEYSADVEVKSIDEMVVKMAGSPSLSHSGGRRPIESRGEDPILYRTSCSRVQDDTVERMMHIGKEIKQRIKDEIGEWLTVSIGISTNRYLAKIASNLHKPDGLDIIDTHNVEQILSSLKLEELTGIKEGYGGRLRRNGITTPMALYRSQIPHLRSAFASKIGYDWWLMLHGWESHTWDRDEVKTIGHSYALRIPYRTDDARLHQILCQLVEKMGRRIRQGNFAAGGMHISCLYVDHSYWNHGEKLAQPVSTSGDLYKEALRILFQAPQKEVRLLAVSSFALDNSGKEQLGLFVSQDKKRVLTDALDHIADRWGEFSVFPARMLGMEHKVLDRIAFGKT